MLQEEVALGDITVEDMAGSLDVTKPSYTEQHARRYEEWTKSFGEFGTNLGGISAAAAPTAALGQ
jgi:hypothetical protein